MQARRLEVTCFDVARIRGYRDSGGLISKSHVETIKIHKLYRNRKAISVCATPLYGNNGISILEKGRSERYRNTISFWRV